jgi:hypothetical protein
MHTHLAPQEYLDCLEGLISHPFIKYLWWQMTQNDNVAKTVYPNFATDHQTFAFWLVKCHFGRFSVEFRPGQMGWSKSSNSDHLQTSRGPWLDLSECTGLGGGPVTDLGGL